MPMHCACERETKELCSFHMEIVRAQIEIERGKARPPIPLWLSCPWCKTLHIDEGEFATKPHHTHACQGCGLTWRPAIENTVGVQFLPGFKNKKIEEAKSSPTKAKGDFGVLCYASFRHKRSQTLAHVSAEQHGVVVFNAEVFNGGGGWQPWPVEDFLADYEPVVPCEAFRGPRNRCMACLRPAAEHKDGPTPAQRGCKGFVPPRTVPGECGFCVLSPEAHVEP